jgi:cytochrome c oxidase assembly factor CtaG
MSANLPAWLTAWNLRSDVVVVLELAAVLFLAGWLHLRWRGVRRLAAGWRLASYLGGLTVLGVALMSAIDVLGGQLFFVHMIQHILLVMIVPPLLLLPNPFPFMLWGLPGGGRMGRWLFAPGSRFRSALRQATRPGVVWMGFVAVLWGWHDPTLYSLAQGSGWVHDVEHLTFFGAAMLLWWHVIGASPRLHGRFPPLARIGYLLATAAANMIPGVVIALADSPLYPYYQGVPRLWGISVMQDQGLSGIIMWIPGTMMYLLAALIIILRTLSRSDRPAVGGGVQRQMRIEPGQL